ncbi:hypothetical protein K8B83_05195 [Shewanella inventionis]|uniref:TonB-dependent receptor n=1 Tax=Shewanella inventionis TaxID=1738770 RepID=A0ABQ1IN85_9GAMM|nr:hypothetical protein [Shewanella inventionis]MCL1156550.1 hypothetical protein [Shewanella inventionis]UAL44243.1 hypothetical protein K8B83_05195 [Shewanella inventionis]GGB46383.1 TonB-dependent receptor [Shewanella inventionis]
MSALNTRVSLLALACAVSSYSVLAEDSSLTNPNISAVLDGYYQTGERPMAERAEGFGLGETELALSANIDEMFYGKITTIVESHDGETELNLEEAFIQTLALPSGLSVRAGRFLSDIGYLNNQHLHTDAFVERPAAYRAFLGNHYFDDGIRLNYVAPTDLYWTMGLEAFAGDSLRAADEHGERDFDDVGVYTALTKIGGDIGVESSWQLGLSYLRNENGLTYAEEHEDEEEVEEDEHDHSHSASYTGENTFIADFVYKWAPNGNYKYQNLTVSGEYFRVTDIFGEEPGHIDDAADEEDHDHEISDSDYHEGWYLSSVYQFSPSWSAGVRYGQIDTYEIHEDHLDAQTLKETDISLAWHSSHFSSVRLQYTHQKGTNFDGFEDDNIVTLQYVMSLGAHGAHQF